MCFLFQERDDWVQAIEQQILSCLQSNESGREKVMHVPVMVGYGQVAQKSSRPKLCHPKFLVKSPEMLSYVDQIFIMLNNILTFLSCLFCLSKS